MSKRRKRKSGRSKRNTVGPVGQVQRQLIDPRPVREQRFFQLPMFRGENPARRDGRVFVAVKRGGHFKKAKPYDPLVVMRQTRREERPPITPTLRDGKRRGRALKDRLVARAGFHHTAKNQARTVVAANRHAVQRDRLLDEWRARICAERAARRQVLHAKKLAGSGGKPPKPPAQLTLIQRAERNVRC